jgi:hypothetical protein
MHGNGNCCVLVSTLAVLGLCLIDPGAAQTRTQELAFGKHKASAAFPCTPKRSKRLVAEVEQGKIYMVSLGCTQADHFYGMSVMEYPPALMQAYSVDELLLSYRDNVRSKPHVQIKSSQRSTLQGFQAIRYDVLDKRSPERALVSLNVVVGQGLLQVTVHARSGLFQPANHATFAKSLKIVAAK